MNFLIRFFSVFLLLSLFAVSTSFGQADETNLTRQQAYLLKWKSIFRDLQPGEDWDKYIERMQGGEKTPGTLGPGATLGDPRQFLITSEMKKYDFNPYEVSRYAIAEGYLLTFDPDWFMNGNGEFTDLSEFDRVQKLRLTNEFDKRKRTEAARKQLLADVKSIHLPKNFYVKPLNTNLMPYDFDKNSFELRIGLTQLFEIKEGEIGYIPLSVQQDFRNLEFTFEIPMEADQAEKLSKEIQSNNMSERKELKSTLWITRFDELRSTPVYIDMKNDYGINQYFSFYPWKYRFDSLTVDLYHQKKWECRIFQTTDLPQPPGMDPLSATAKPDAFVLEKELDAPPKAVYDAWMNAEKVKQWFVPPGYEMSVFTIDGRPRGKMHYCIKDANGSEFCGLGIFEKIVPNQQLIALDSYADNQGNAIRNPYLHNWPIQMRTVVDFIGNKGKTKLKITSLPVDPSPEEAAAFESGKGGMEQTWTVYMKQLAAYLEK